MNGSEQKKGTWEVVLTLVPPSAIWTYAQYFLILELADRKWEADKIYNEQAITAKESERKDDSLDELNKAWSRIMILVLGIITIVLKIVMLLFYFIGFVRKPIKNAIDSIEKAIQKKANNTINLNNCVRIKTMDELVAEKGVKRFECMIHDLHEQFKDNSEVLSYINLFHSSSMAIGQRWAIAELSCRATESSTDRAEALWRGSFMIRAFGFGTIKLIKQLLAILAIGMAVPFLINIFVRNTPNYSVMANLAQGIGWTAIFWAITLALTLYFNDRRMAKIWKRAKVASLMAQRTRSEELIHVFGEVKTAIKNCIVPFLSSVSCPVMRLLIEDNFKEIDAQIKREQKNIFDFNSKIKILEQNLKLTERIKQILDTSSQGDAVEQIGSGIGDLL